MSASAKDHLYRMVIVEVQQYLTKPNHCIWPIRTHYTFVSTNKQFAPKWRRPCHGTAAFNYYHPIYMILGHHLHCLSLTTLRYIGHQIRTNVLQLLEIERRNIISFVPWSSNIYCQQKLHKNLKLLASAIRNQENLISGEKERPVELSRDLITLSKNIDLSDLLNHGMKRNFVGKSIKKNLFLQLPSEICYFCYLFYKLHKQS